MVNRYVVFHAFHFDITSRGGGSREWAEAVTPFSKKIHSRAKLIQLKTTGYLTRNMLSLGR